MRVHIYFFSRQMMIKSLLDSQRDTITHPQKRFKKTENTHTILIITIQLPIFTS